METTINSPAKTFCFARVQLRQTYAPLKLECIAKAPSDGRRKKVIGENYDGQKKFIPNQKYSLYCLYGRDIFEEYHLFCNDTPDADCFKIVNGGFDFVFNADEFFQLLKNASWQNWKNFTQNTILTNKDELIKFSALVQKDTELTHKQRNRATAFIQKLQSAPLYHL